MKPFFALYVKELKAHKILFLFVLLLIVGLNIYGLIQIENVSQEHIALNKFPMAIIWTILSAFSLALSLPFLLAHAFNAEWKSETHYQVFALPVSQYTVNLAKIAVVASMGFVGGGIVVGTFYLAMIQIANLLSGPKIVPFEGKEVISFFDFGFLFGLILVAYMVFSLGLVTGMEGVKFAVKRYRGLTAVVFFLIAVFLYIRFFQQGKVALDFLGHISVTLSGQIELAPFVYTILMGITFMIIGLVMYEKRAEI